MEKYFINNSNRIKAGNKHTMYMKYCTACNIYKSILASPPMGPGGTLSCPICRSRKEHGPGIEQSYGKVKIKAFEITLPIDVEV